MSNNNLTLSKNGSKKLIELMKQPNQKSSKFLKSSGSILNKEQIKIFGKEPIKVILPFELKERK